MRRAALLVLLAAFPFPAGCGGSDEASGPAPARGEADVITVSATDFAFQPAAIEVDEPGEVTIRLVNDGQAPHALALTGPGVDEATPTIAPGESAELAVELAEGAYELACPVGDHAERGMVGTLAVGGAPPDGGGSGGSPYDY